MDLFDERGVYDVTFGYNLARLNLDRRHPDAGFRYAEDRDDPSVLLAEFTPTTRFARSRDAHRRRVPRVERAVGPPRLRPSPSPREPSHHQSASINDQLQELETRYRQTGELRTDGGDEASDDSVPV